MSDFADKDPEKIWSISRKPILYPWCSAHSGFQPIFYISLHECAKCGSGFSEKRRIYAKILVIIFVVFYFGRIAL